MFNKQEDVLIDVEGFYEGKNFIVKELTILNLENCKGVSYTFKLEQKPTKQTNWTVKKLHNLPLSCGSTDFDHITSIISCLKIFRTRIISKGLEKCRFLATLFNMPAVDLAAYGCPSYKILHEKIPSTPQDYCQLHVNHQNYHCSQLKTKLLYNYIYNNKML